MCSPELFNAKHNKLLPLFVIKVELREAVRGSNVTFQCVCHSEHREESLSFSLAHCYTDTQ